MSKFSPFEVILEYFLSIKIEIHKVKPMKVQCIYRNRTHFPQASQFNKYAKYIREIPNDFWYRTDALILNKALSLH